MRNVRIETLEKAFTRIVKKLRDEGVERVALDKDVYRYIPTHGWDEFSDPEIEVGSLYDDLDGLEALVKDESRPCTYVDLDRVASILRAISDELNPG